MDNVKFKGVFTALLTPFNAEDKIDGKALERLIRFNVDRGVQGFYVGGSTGEAFMLSTDERKYVYDIVKSVAPDKTLIAHVGSISEREAIELGKHAGALGYDAVSSVAPFYYKFTFNEVKNYYYTVAERSGLPMLVYNFPAFSGVNMNVEQMASFLCDERFIGIKHTSSDFFALEQCKAAFPDKIIYNGYDEMFLAGLAMGADGGVGSTYNFMADKFVAIRRLFNEGRIAEAQEIQKTANKIITVLCQIGVMQAEKEVLNQLGLDFGVCRHPFVEPTDEQKKLIADEILPLL